jgi:hypothetical protein
MIFDQKAQMRMASTGMIARREKKKVRDLWVITAPCLQVNAVVDTAVFQSCRSSALGVGCMPQEEDSEL